MRRLNLFSAAVFTIFSLGVLPAAAATLNLTVFGVANPFLSGQPAGATCCGADAAPDNSPLEVALPAGTRQVIFSQAQGGVSNDPNTASFPLFGPNGNAGWLVSDSAANGVGGFVNGPLNGLVGVFLGAGLPNGSGQADFSAPTSTPALNDVFFIGDGKLGTGAPVAFRAPVGATRLFLGVIDGYDWRNNVGAFTLDVTASPAPELSTWAMMGLGLAGIGLLSRFLPRKRVD